MAMEPNPIAYQVRAMVQWAYSEQMGIEGSIFEIFSGKRTKSAELKPSKRCDGLSATRIHAVESQKSGKSKIPIASGRSGGEIKRAVAQLDALEQNWIHYCYNPSPQRKEASAQFLVRALWANYQSNADLKGVHSRTRVIVSYLLRAQLVQARSYSGFQKWSESRPEEFANAVSRSMWHDTYKPHWLAIRGMLERLDNKAMLDIHSQLPKNKA